MTAVYLDNHSTTRTDPRVVEAMLPYFTDQFGNPGSTSHVYGWDARDVVKNSRDRIARMLGASERDIVFTSGATESNNLAIKGVAERLKRRGNHIISVATEHKSVLDPLNKLSRRGFDITLLRVEKNGSRGAGRLDLSELENSIRPTSILVSVMLANNEIGVIQPLPEIADVCRRHNLILHCDAVQAVGKVPVFVDQLGVDLMSLTAHKFYGPKGVGALYVRRKNLSARLEPLLEGGGQEGGIRSGTLNVPGIVGMATALQLCHDELGTEQIRLASLRNRLFENLKARIAGVELNGPPLFEAQLRLPGNLNCSISGVNGEALMMSMRDVAVSSGSACGSTNPEPSHVLQALGLPEDLTRSSLRFGLGRFTTESDIDFAVETIATTVARLRSFATIR